MRADRYGILGFARPRSTWFGEVGRWAMSGRLPIDFVKCVSAAELRSRLEATAGVSAALVDGGGHGVDRDLLAAARDRSIAVIVVERLGTASRDWLALGAAAVIEDGFDAEELLAVLRSGAQPRREITNVSHLHPDVPTAAYAAPLVAVTGVRGSGTSTVAAALAQGLARRADGVGSVCLADFALDAMQSTYHDATDVTPALQELVEAHRGGALDRASVRACTFDVEHRGYSLLLGLRRPSDWTALPSRATDAAISSLRGTFRWVVADCTPEFDGDSETGSIDVEERNHLARRCVQQAAAILVVGTPDLRGVRQLVRLIDDLIASGIDANDLVAVINRAPRSPAARAQSNRAIAELATAAPAGFVHLPARRSTEGVHRGVEAFPAALVSPLVAAVGRVIDSSHTRASGLDGVDSDHVPMAIAR